MDGKEIYSILQATFPDEAALSWDNVGLLCGRMDRDIQKIYVTLDADMKSVERAAAVGADLILTHHPLIFSGIKRIREGDYLGERILKIIEKNMACYAMHTNYDVKRMGKIVAERMGITDYDILEPTVEDGTEGIGFTGNLSEPVSLGTYGRRIKEWFHIPGIRIYGDPEQKIDRVSVCPGSAKGMEGFALAQGGQVLIGGDFGHHEGLDCLEKKIAVIDAGHYGLEHIFVEDMAGFLKAHCPDIEVYASPVEYPFQCI